MSARKLTEDQANAMRSERSRGMSLSRLARAFGVSATAVRHVLGGATYNADARAAEVKRRRARVEAGVSRRFWAAVDRDGPRGCWLWTRALDAAGYGAIKGATKVVKAHRLSWEIANGPIPGDLHVLHRCDTPRCVNPRHLFLGTNADNIADMVAKGRRKGELQCWAKLTVPKVREARRRRANGEPINRLAAEYGVSAWAMGSAIVGKTWGHVR